MTRVQHSSPKKNRLIGAIQAGKTIAQAAETVDIPFGTAKKIWAKFQKTGSTTNRPRSGRPPKVDEHMHRLIVWKARKNRKMPFRQIGNLVEPRLSASTVGRHVAEENYHRRVARRVPFLKPDQKRKRLAWARRNRSQDWKKVIWSDECYVYIGDTRGRVWVTRRPDEVFDEDCLIPTFKQSSIRVMVWACIMEGRKGPLVVMEYPGGKGGGMNAKRYQEQVLEGKLAKFYEDMKSERDGIVFQQDGAPSHTAKTTLKWFASHNITLFPHPPSSPDLNPIECVWRDLKKHVRARQHPPTSTEELIAAVKEAWNVIPVKDIDRYIKRMDEVVAAVVKAKGGHTRY
jgi:transposase